MSFLIKTMSIKSYVTLLLLDRNIDLINILHIQKTKLQKILIHKLIQDPSFE